MIIQRQPFWAYFRGIHKHFFTQPELRFGQLTFAFSLIIAKFHFVNVRTLLLNPARFVSKFEVTYFAYVVMFHGRAELLTCSIMFFGFLSFCLSVFGDWLVLDVVGVAFLATLFDSNLIMWF